jgi:uncharacterized protein (TIGR03083 family)
VVEHRLSPTEHLAWIRENVGVVLGVPLDQLEAKVVDCPGWRLDSVANHLAINSMAYEACVHSPPGANVTEAIAWAWRFESSSGQAAVENCRVRFDNLLAILAGMDPYAPCPFIVGDADVATWLLHVAIETWVHRADVEHTLGVTPDLGPEAGLEALDWSRYWRVWYSEQGAGEPPPAIRCHATDADVVLVLGSGPVAASVAGKGCDLALRLWNRQHGPLEGDCVDVQTWADLA